MNKKYLRKITQTDERMRDVLRLKKEKKYNEIFKLYGKEIYNEVIPKQYKEKEVINLIKQGNLEELYVKYSGEKIYKKNLDYIKAEKKYLETGKKTPIVLNRIKNTIFRKIFPTALSITMLPPTAVTVASTVLNNKTREKNAIEYEEEIENYNNTITKYAEEIKKMDLTDIQIIMKVVSDMWENINGYGNPQKDITGYYRLDMANEGVGVCRNMADDVTAKLNAINPEYNARNMVCYIDENAGIENFANIKRTYDNTGNIQTEEEKEEQTQTNQVSVLEAIIIKSLRSINREPSGNCNRYSRQKCNNGCRSN